MRTARIIDAVLCSRVYQELQKQAETGPIVKAVGEAAFKAQDAFSRFKPKVGPAIESLWGGVKELMQAGPRGEPRPKTVTPPPPPAPPAPAPPESPAPQPKKV